ncbi:MAG: hypothetical protein U9N09_07080 [Euryarchaeota archaeon]|nr:hypothetical protein [Euryarchaeota archaeon]
MSVRRSINQFLYGDGKNKGRKPDERYASFDFCYNYFYSFYKRNKLDELADEKNLQMSCLQLGFYLASWGMMRGSSFLLEKSIKNYKNLIIIISKMNPILWEIDVDNYDEENIKLLLNCKKQIIEVIRKENKPSDTLVTKIMLGIFANVPAYDYNFKKFLKKNQYCQTFNKTSLNQIKKFYEENNEVFNSYEIHTFDFRTSNDTDNIYTKAKLIDMYGFIAGQ